MAYCSNCGQPADGSFCRNCGARLQPPTGTPAPQQTYGERLQQMTPIQQTIRGDVNTLVLGIFTIVGFVGGGALWLWLLYDPKVTAQSMVWFFGAIAAALVGGYLGRWLTVSLVTR